MKDEITFSLFVEEEVQQQKLQSNQDLAAGVHL